MDGVVRVGEQSRVNFAEFSTLDDSVNTSRLNSFSSTGLIFVNRGMSSVDISWFVSMSKNCHPE
jgi:hypothetical protein